MHPSVILKVIGVLLMLFSFTLVPPFIIAIIYDDAGDSVFLWSFAVTIISGMMCWFPVQHINRELHTRDGFLVVVLFWSVLALFGSIPFLIFKYPVMNFTDAFFESMSGLTTTGATILTGIDELPKSILFYRQQLQWLGGMGIIVLAVAVLPMLGIGGMQLYRAETPGPVKDSKLTPRITETAKALWYVYLFLTVSCALGYWIVGMSLFDAVSHSFTTVAIGGFSTHDASIGYFDNLGVEIITMIFMLISVLNFALHFYTWRNRRSFNLTHYIKDPEVQTFFFVLLSICFITCLYLIANGTYDSWQEALRYGLFEAISITTTTGYGVANFSNWPSLLPVLLIMGSFMGGCAGSTGGGIKVIRVLLLYKQGAREIKKLIHPSAIILLKIGNKPVPERVIEAVWGFLGVYLLLFILLMLGVNATGLDFETSFSAVAACLNNLGPGIGSVSDHYGEISNGAKWILCLAMLLGRLEIFTLLVIINPMFWRR